MIAPTYFHDGRATLYGGDCLEVLKQIADNSIDAVCTDPPYHLTSIVQRFGGENAAPALSASQRRFRGSGGGDRMPGPDQYGRLSRGFMGKQWDGGDIAFRPELWREVLRVLKPGGHLVAFAAPKNRDLMSMAIREAGFEVRDEIMRFFSLSGIERAFLETLTPDQAEALARILDHREDCGLLGWAFGSGFPKSHDVSKAIDKSLGAAREKIRVDAGEVRNPKATGAGRDGMAGATRPWIERAIARGFHEKAGETPAYAPARQWQGWGTALKPALEPICLARKTLIGPVAENVLAHGTGAINIDGCRVETGDVIAATRNVALGSSGSGVYGGADKPGVYEQKSGGRWPANVVHDGSEQVLAAFPDSAGAAAPVKGHEASETGQNGIYGRFGRVASQPIRNDSGSAARFFYSAKADRDDRLGSKHPTVKPLDLMRWLVRLVTPPGGTVLDPFAGTGTTGHGALLEGFNAILIEREEEYRADIARRMALVFAGETERAHAIVKARGEEEAHDTLPLFGGGA